MKEKLTIVKVGGKILEEKSSLELLISEFAALPGCKILVHGGGRTATKVAEGLGIETHMVDGRRITDEPMLNVVTMVYGGLVNKNVVALLHTKGVKALGLTGADLDVVRSHKRVNASVDFGFVGDVDKVDGNMLVMLLRQGITPVLAPLTHDGMGHLLNTNADTIASQTARALSDIFDVSLVFCFEKKGVLSNPDDDNSVISHIDAACFEKLKLDGIVQGGMLPKLVNSFEALQAGVSRVVITKVGQLTDCCAGTIVTL